MPHCQCAYILFHLDETEEEGVKDLVSIKKSTTKSGRRAIEMSMRDWRRKREWTRENGRPPKVKEWSGRGTNSREGVCALEGESKEEKQWWESTLVQERERGRLRSDRVTEQKEDRKWGWRAGKKSGDGGKESDRWWVKVLECPPQACRHSSSAAPTDLCIIVMHCMCKLKHYTMITWMAAVIS